jgi:DNA polymerase-4
VVCAASYEARTFGIRSAMPALRAERLCPEAVFVAPDFTRYRAASKAVREIFRRHTELVEPLSLDEAFLDVTVNKAGLPTATAVAKAIRAQIREELRLTASAGVAPNKFLAKLASDMRKPDGLFVIRPEEVDAFLLDLPVGRIPGVGRVTDSQLAALGIRTISELRGHDAAALERRFGKYGRRLHELARGHDERPVQPNQPTQSISAEDTFEADQALDAMDAKIRDLAAKVWRALQQERRVPRTVVLKLMKLGKRLMERHKLAFAVAPDVVQQIVRLCTVAQSGARNIDNILDQRLMPEISRQLLAGMAEGKAYTHLFVSGDGNEGFGLNFSEGDFVMPENTAEEDMVEEAMADASKAAETTA